MFSSKGPLHRHALVTPRIAILKRMELTVPPNQLSASFAGHASLWQTHTVKFSLGLAATKRLRTSRFGCLVLEWIPGWTPRALTWVVKFLKYEQKQQQGKETVGWGWLCVCACVWKNSDPSDPCHAPHMEFPSICLCCCPPPSVSAVILPQNPISLGLTSQGAQPWEGLVATVNEAVVGRGWVDQLERLQDPSMDPPWLPL